MQLLVASLFPLPAIEPSVNHLLQWRGLHAPYENLSLKDRAGQQCSPSELEDVHQDPFVDARPLFEDWVPEGVSGSLCIRLMLPLLLISPLLLSSLVSSASLS